MAISDAEALDRIFGLAQKICATNIDWCAWLTAVHLSNEKILVRWAGGDEVWLVGNNEVMARTEGHRHEVLSSIFTKGIGRPYSDEPESRTFPVAHVEHLVLVSASIARELDEKRLLDALAAADPIAALIPREPSALDYASVIAVPGAR